MKMNGGLLSSIGQKVLLATSGLVTITQMSQDPNIRSLIFMKVPIEPKERMSVWGRENRISSGEAWRIISFPATRSMTRCPVVIINIARKKRVNLEE